MLTKIGLLYENIYCTNITLNKRERLIDELDTKTREKLYKYMETEIML